MGATVAVVAVGAALAAYTGSKQDEAKRRAGQISNGARIDTESAIAQQKVQKQKDTEAAAMAAGRRQAKGRARGDGLPPGSGAGTGQPLVPALNAKDTMLGSVGDTGRPSKQYGLGSTANNFSPGQLTTLLGTAPAPSNNNGRAK